MSVHYKFKSAVEYDTLPVDGLNISLGDLKEAIIQQKRLGKGQPYDLQITNAETKEEYVDEKKLIPKNSSLIVARVPIDATLMKRPWENNKEATDLILSNPSNLMNTEDAAEAAEIDRKLKEVADLTRMEGSEQDKINAMVAQSTMAYHPSRYVKLRASKMRGTVPSGYKCYKCNQSGHWVTMCPLNNQDLRKSTGIPSMFLEEVKDATAPGVMLSATGKLVRLRDTGDNERLGMDIPPNERLPPPEELECLLCKELLKDAVLISCCAAAFCDECIRNHLLDSEEHECPECKKDGIGPDTLIPNRYLRIKVQQFESGCFYGEKKVDGPGDASELVSAVPAHVLQTNNTPTPPHSPAHPASPARIRISDKVNVSPASQTAGSPVRQSAVSPAQEASPARVSAGEPIGNGDVESDKENIMMNENPEKREEIRDAVSDHECPPPEEPVDSEAKATIEEKENIGLNDLDADVDEKPKKIKKKKAKRKNSRHDSEEEKDEKERKKRERRGSHRSQDRKVASLEKKSKRREMELLKDVADLPPGTAELWDDDSLTDRISHKGEDETAVSKKKKKHRNKDMLKDIDSEENDDMWNDERIKTEVTEANTNRSRSNSGDNEKENTAIYDTIVPFNPLVPPPNMCVKSPPQDYRYPVTSAYVPTVPPTIPVPADINFPHYQPGIPPPTLTNPPISYPRHHSSYSERELIADPLTEFQKHLREKDERERKWRYSRSRSPSRSPRYRRVRSRSRQRSWSRSRSPSLSRPRVVSTRSPRSPSRRRWNSRSPPPRGHASYRSRSPSFPRERSLSNRSLSLSRTPSPSRRIKSSPLHVHQVKHVDTHALARPSMEFGAPPIHYNRYPPGTLPPHDQFPHQIPPPFHTGPPPAWDPHARYNQPGHENFKPNFTDQRGRGRGGRRGRGFRQGENFGYDHRGQDYRNPYDRSQRLHEDRRMQGSGPWEREGRQSFNTEILRSDRGNRHSDGERGNRHSDGERGNRHSDGERGNRHSDGERGNRHSDGERGSRHSDSERRRFVEPGTDYDEIRPRRDNAENLRRLDEGPAQNKYSDDEEWRKYSDDNRKREEEPERRSRYGGRRVLDDRKDDPDLRKASDVDDFEDYKRLKKDGEGRKSYERNYKDVDDNRSGRHDREGKHRSAVRRDSPRDDDLHFRSKSYDSPGKSHKKSPPRERRDREGDRRDRDIDRKDREVDKRDRESDRRDREGDRRERDGDRRDKEIDRRDKEGDRKDKEGDRRVKDNDRRDRDVDRRERDDRRDRDVDKQEREGDRRDKEYDRKDNYKKDRDQDRRLRDGDKKDKEGDRRERESSKREKDSVSKDKNERNHDDDRRDKDPDRAYLSRWDHGDMKLRSEKELEGKSKSRERERNVGAEEKEHKRKSKRKEEKEEGHHTKEKGEGAADSENLSKVEKKKHDRKKKKKEKRRASQASTEASQAEVSGDEGEDKKKKKKREKKRKTKGAAVEEGSEELVDKVTRNDEKATGDDLREQTNEAAQETSVNNPEMTPRDKTPDPKPSEESPAALLPLPPLSKWERDEELPQTPKGLVESKAPEEEKKVTVDILKRAENTIFSGRGLATRKVFLDPQKQKETEEKERSPTPEWDRMEMREAKRRGPSIQITISSKTESQIGRPRGGRYQQSSPERSEEKRYTLRSRRSDSDSKSEKHSSRSQKRSQSPSEPQSTIKTRRKSEKEELAKDDKEGSVGTERTDVNIEGSTSDKTVTGDDADKYNIPSKEVRSEDAGPDNEPDTDPEFEYVPEPISKPSGDLLEDTQTPEGMDINVKEEKNIVYKGVKRSSSSTDELEVKKLKTEDESTGVEFETSENTSRTESIKNVEEEKLVIKGEPEYGIPVHVETSIKEFENPNMHVMHNITNRNLVVVPIAGAGGEELEEGEIPSDSLSECGNAPDETERGAPLELRGLVEEEFAAEDQDPSDSLQKIRYSPIRVPSPLQPGQSKETLKVKEKSKKRKKRKRSSSSSSSNSSSSSSSSSSEEEEIVKKKKKKKKKKKAVDSDSSDGESQKKHKKKKKEKKKKKKKEKKKKSDK